MQTVCFIETDEYGNVEWSEGCVAFSSELFEFSKELVDKKEVEDIIKKLEDRISELSWSLYPDRMGG